MGKSIIKMKLGTTMIAGLGVIIMLLQIFLGFVIINDYYTIAISLILLISAALLRNRDTVSDMCFLLLITRCITLLISIMINYDNNFKSYINGAYISSLVAVVAYVSSREFSNKQYINFLYTAFKFCYVIVFFQVAICFLRNSAVADLAVRKYYIEIPFGNSNSIAMIFYTLGLFLIVIEKNKGLRWLWIVLLLLASVMLASRGGMIVLAVMLIGLWIKNKAKRKTISKNTLVLAICICGIVCIICIVFRDTISNVLGSVLQPIISKLQLFLEGDYHGATTNRTIIYSSYIARISKNPVFGYGTEQIIAAYNQYELMRPHNLILEALYQGGIINIVLYISAVIIAFRRLNEKCIENNAIKIACIFLIMHSMVEPGLFTINKDFIFWIILGSGLSIKKQRTEVAVAEVYNIN